MVNDTLVAECSDEVARLRRENSELRALCDELLHPQQPVRRPLDDPACQRQLYHLLLDNCTDAVQTLTPEGVVLATNRAGVEMFGCGDPEKPVGRLWQTQWSRESRESAQQALDQAGDGEVAECCVTSMSDGGDEQVWRSVVAPVVNTSGQPIVLVSVTRTVSDVDRRNQTASETDFRFRALADNMAQLAWMADEHGSVFWFNQRWFSYTGTTLEEMKGWGWRQVHHPDHLERVVRKIRNAFAGGQVWEDTFPLRHKDGKYRWFLSRAMPIRDADGNVVRWFGTATDITRQLVTQTKLRESEDKLRLGIAVARVAISEIDYVSGTAQLSKRAAEMYGLPTDQLEVPREVLQNLVYPDDRKAVSELVENTRHGKDVGKICCEHRIIRPCDGKVRWLRVNEQVFFETDESGRKYPSTSLIAAHDITDQKNVQTEQERARQLAEQASQAKSDFLANMSHEIRTPMTAILGYADILNRHLSNPDDLNCVKTIRRNGLYLLDIINDILDLSRIEEGRLEMEHVGFSPIELVEETRSLMDVRAYEKRIPLRVEYESTLPRTIKCDPTRLRQILVNLVANAIKFTEQGGVQLAVRYLPATNIIEFSVIDSGIGISRDAVERLFQPFTQADNSTTRRYGGSGLGLTISQRLARLMGGEIRVESELTQGSTFTLAIAAGCQGSPTLVDPSAQIPVEQILDETHLGQCIELDCQVLVVDDRRDVRFLVQYIIEEAGGTVRLANNGQHALEIIDRSERQGNTPVDLVLMDLQMPKMGGLEATRRLRSSGFEKPVVALTANAMKGDRETCIAAGCTDYLTKPIDKNLLLETIARHVGGRPTFGGPVPGKGFATRFCESVSGYRGDPREQSNDERQPSGCHSPETTGDSDNGCRVLLVEDHADAGRMLQQYLELDGHQVTLVKDGSSAIETAASWLPHVIIMDLGLPDMSGLDVARQLRRDPELNNVRMIALTGRAEASDQQESLGAGFDYHLVKPAKLSRLEQLVRTGRRPPTGFPKSGVKSAGPVPGASSGP